MQIQPYLSFNGNCSEAMEFYADVFGTDHPEINLFGEMIPEQQKATADQITCPADPESDSTRVLFSDIAPKPWDVQKNKITLVIFSDDLDEIEMLYDKLKDEGIVEVELQETFWSKAYSLIIDKYGVVWQLNYDDGRMHQVV